MEPSNQETTNTPKKILPLIIVGVVILTIIIGGALFLFLGNRSNSNQSDSTIIPTEGPVPTGQNPAAKPALVNCGFDSLVATQDNQAGLKCFSSNAESCTPAILRLDVLKPNAENEITIREVRLYETSSVGLSCTLNSKVEAATFIIPTGTPSSEEMSAKGRLSVENALKSQGTCTFSTPNDLVDIFMGLAAGRSTSELFSRADCTGSL